MKSVLISGFIDDELDLDEKIDLVEIVHEQVQFKEEAVGLLQQEKLVRGKVVDHIPAVVFHEKRWFRMPLWRPIGAFAAGLAAAVLIMFFVLDQPEVSLIATHRFVLYQPEVKKVEITGSFIGWSAVSMKKTGSSGYWEAVLEIPVGEHRICYIIEGNRRIPDPTISIREKDDFGGENSILAVNLET